MSFRIEYQPVATVHFWNDFELSRGQREFASLNASLQQSILRDYRISDSIRIGPDAKTRQLLTNHKLKFRPIPTGFQIAGSVVPSESTPGQFTLERPLPDSFRLKFLLNPARSGFLEEINLPIRTDAAHRFHFTNETNNTAPDGSLHLTRLVSAFDPAAAYLAGDLVVDDDANPTALLQCVEDAPPNATPDPQHWATLPARPYSGATEYAMEDLVLHDGSIFEARNAGTLPSPPDAANWNELHPAELRTGVSRSDLALFTAGDLRIPLNPAQPFVRLTLRDRTGSVIRNETLIRNDHQPLEEAVVPLSGLDPGRYTIEALQPDNTPIAAIPSEVILHPADPSLGLVELAAGQGGFRVFDAQGHLLRPEFQVRFRQRQAFWRYRFHGDLEGLPPADLGPLIQEDPADPAQYRTASALPLNRGHISVAKFNTGELLPNPAPGSVRRDSGRLFAEIHLKN